MLRKGESCQLSLPQVVVDLSVVRECRRFRNDSRYSGLMDTVLLILAVICFLIAAFNLKLGTISFGWLGLALYVVTALTP